jgi:hypothetical protein
VTAVIEEIEDLELIAYLSGGTDPFSRPCERLMIECPRVAVRRVTYSTCPTHGGRKQRLCLPCYDYLADPTDGLPIMCFIDGCEEEVVMLFVEPIR